tara:strand:+ start:74696 stop:75946 length:1251 start_codon:yes stop_codon:yes gene_type:complete
MALLLCGNALLETTISYRTALLSQSASSTSMIMASYYVGFLVGGWHLPYLLRFITHRQVFILLAIIFSSLIYALSLRHTAIAVATLQFGCGVCISGLYVAAESFINVHSNEKSRQRTFSYYMLIWYFGVGCGQLPLLSSHGFNSYFFNFSALLVLLSMLPAVFIKSRSAISTHGVGNPLPADSRALRNPCSANAIGFRQLASSFPRPFVLSIISGMFIGILFAMSPVFGELYFNSSRQSALMIIAFVLGAGIVQLMLTQLTHHQPTRVLRVLTWSGTVCTLTALLLSFTQQLSLIKVILLALLLGACALPIYSLAAAWIQTIINENTRVTASALLLLCNGFGSILGPLWAGQLMHYWGSTGFYLSLLTGFVITHFLLYKQHKPSTFNSAEELRLTTNQAHSFNQVPLNTTKTAEDY